MSENRNIYKENHLPTPPDGGNWPDKGRDHDVFQLNVSLAAQLGGVSASAGCPTPEAKAAREEAEQAYYRRSEIHHDLILTLKEL